MRSRAERRVVLASDGARPANDLLALPIVPQLFKPTAAKARPHGASLETPLRNPAPPALIPLPATTTHKPLPTSQKPARGSCSDELRLVVVVRDAQCIKEIRTRCRLDVPHHIYSTSLAPAPILPLLPRVSLGRPSHPRSGIATSESKHTLCNITSAACAQS
ncbi:hypothetical protein C8R45DRAFT_1068885, partial [Mycena sanguinolenta]